MSRVSFVEHRGEQIIVMDFSHLGPGTVVGIEGLLNIALTAVSKFSGRTFKTFKDRQSAMDWLVER